MNRRFTATAAAVGAVALPIASSQTAEAAPTPVEKPHCSTRALTAAQIDRGERSTVACFPTFVESMAALGVTVPANATPRDLRIQSVAALSGVLAIHYDGFSASGSSLSVGGTDCGGGGISLPAGDSWNDRISSTKHQLCGRVKHWTDANYSGTSQLTEGGFNVARDMNSSLHDNVTSIRYYEPLN
jgi:hypothetical protein